MLYSYLSSTLLLVSGLTLALPVERNPKIAGAAYLMTNEASGNNILVNAIDSSGRLSFSHAVYTGGKGGHADNNNTSDGLVSQDSVKVGKNMLFAVNAGSNTVTMFKINHWNPSQIRMVGKPVYSGGDFPVSVAFSDKTGEVCVLNGGRVNGVQCYQTDMTKGLVPIPNTIRHLGVNQTTPPSGPPGTVSDLLFSSNGEELYVSVKGTPPTPGFIATYKVNKSDGSLSDEPVKTTPATGGGLPFSMTLLPHTNAVLATDPAAGFAIFDFARGSPANSTIHPIKNQGATCWSSLSRKTGNLYLTDAGTSIVTEVYVSPSLNASIIKQYPLGPESVTIDSAVGSIKGNDFLYVLSANATSIDVLALKGPGKASHMQRLNIQSAIASSGSHVTTSPLNLQGMATYVMTK
ncbi:lactonase, 7-bladed beta-propeller [Ceratobasidium sp. AG-Ba]|nr:lactonase, 7-bladed beta-propeller [Ceratobasidium sp. AG-Ba]